ncbi:unnamed protein product [Arctogadus glacialis]
MVSVPVIRNCPICPLTSPSLDRWGSSATSLPPDLSYGTRTKGTIFQSDSMSVKGSQCCPLSAVPWHRR